MVLKVVEEHLVNLVLKVIMVMSVKLVSMDVMVTMVPLAHKVHEELWEKLVDQELRVFQDQKVH
jgi:hypothetical protein